MFLQLVQVEQWLIITVIREEEEQEEEALAEMPDDTTLDKSIGASACEGHNKL